MILETLVFGTLAAAVFDARLTTRRMRQYGPQVELNGHITWLTEKLGIDLGVFVGVIGPTVLWVFGSLLLNLPLVTAFYAGLKIKWFVTQLESLMFERNLRKLQKELNEKGKED